MFGAPVQSGLTLSRVIGGLVKTLSVANRVIPLYKEAKPMIQNARTIIGVLKDMNKKSPSNIMKVNKEPIKKDPIKEVKIMGNTPTFFL